MSKNRGLVHENPARDFVDAVDARNIYLYRKDGYILSYLRILPFNLDLLSNQEKEALCESITAKLRDNRKNFAYACLPREVDLDGYKKNIKDLHRQQTDIGRRYLLSCMMNQATNLTLGGNYEHQLFLKIWEYNTNKEKAEEYLNDRIHTFKNLHEDNGIECEILGEREIVKLCNLFGNSLQANFERVPEHTQHSTVMWID